MQNRTKLYFCWGSCELIPGVTIWFTTFFPNTKDCSSVWVSTDERKKILNQIYFFLSNLTNIMLRFASFVCFEKTNGKYLQHIIMIVTNWYLLVFGWEQKVNQKKTKFNFHVFFGVKSTSLKCFWIFFFLVWNYRFSG